MVQFRWIWADRPAPAPQSDLRRTCASRVVLWVPARVAWIKLSAPQRIGLRCVQPLGNAVRELADAIEIAEIAGHRTGRHLSGDEAGSGGGLQSPPEGDRWCRTDSARVFLDLLRSWYRGIGVLSARPALKEPGRHRAQFFVSFGKLLEKSDRGRAPA